MYLYHFLMRSPHVKYDHDSDQGCTANNFLDNPIDDNWYHGCIMCINLVSLVLGAGHAGTEAICGGGVIESMWLSVTNHTVCIPADGTRIQVSSQFQNEHKLETPSREIVLQGNVNDAGAGVMVHMSGG
jgi:hypothetical protein